METHIERAKTALVVIDLQQGIVGMETAPHAAKDVVEHAAELTEAFRKNDMPVVLVRVSFSPDGKNALKPQTDGTAMSMSRAAGWDEIVPALGPKEGDIVITKHQWGGVLRHRTRPRTPSPRDRHDRALRHLDQHRRRKYRALRL